MVLQPSQMGLGFSRHISNTWLRNWGKPRQSYLLMISSKKIYLQIQQTKSPESPKTINSLNNLIMQMKRLMFSQIKTILVVIRQNKRQHKKYLCWSKQIKKSKSIHMVLKKNQTTVRSSLLIERSLANSI